MPQFFLGNLAGIGSSPAHKQYFVLTGVAKLGFPVIYSLNLTVFLSICSFLAQHHCEGTY